MASKRKAKAASTDEAAPDTENPTGTPVNTGSPATSDEAAPAVPAKASSRLVNIFDPATGRRRQCAAADLATFEDLGYQLEKKSKE